ncbi:MAG: transcription elongation factor GreA [Bacilli bacterium]|nr:transcription elongation factor GreA [Bacilli bacterium]
MAEEKKIILTQEGVDKLNAEYRHLNDVDRKEVIEALQSAREQGDLSENADYDSARARQGQIESRINEIEHILDHAIVIRSEGDGKTVNIGSYVEYKDGDEVRLVKITGSVETDPFAEPPSISNESPLGAALLGRAQGEKVYIECDEPYEVEITNILKQID